MLLVHYDKLFYRWKLGGEETRSRLAPSRCFYKPLCYGIYGERGNHRASLFIVQYIQEIHCKHVYDIWNLLSAQSIINSVDYLRNWYITQCLPSSKYSQSSSSTLFTISGLSSFHFSYRRLFHL